MTTNINSYKECAKNLRSAVSSVLNVECTQSQAYELIAKEENYPNWDALSGSINKLIKKDNDATNVLIDNLSKKDQIFQLFLMHEGISSNAAFYDVLSILKEQKNLVMRNAWSNVQLSKDMSIIDVINDSHLFSDEVISILDMSFRTGVLDRGIKSAIEFLKIQ